MRSLLSEFTRDLDQNRTVVVMDEDGLAPPRQYVVSPLPLILRALGGLVAVALVTFLVVAVTPLRNLIPGYSTAQMRQDAEQNMIRLTQLEDSLALQAEYMNHLRGLVTGEPMDSTFLAASMMPSSGDGARPGDASVVDGREPGPVSPGPAGSDVGARPLQTRTVALTSPRFGSGAPASGGLSLPALAPVEGFVTRPYNARSEHYAVDIAVSEGTTVRAIGDGYVVVADWTQAGGYAVAIQHAGGYLSVYKHNSQLLKRVGERVRVQEPIARTGNTGEVTTGPHLHFELWRDGIPQDPRRYVLGW